MEPPPPSTSTDPPPSLSSSSDPPPPTSSISTSPSPSQPPIPRTAIQRGGMAIGVPANYPQPPRPQSPVVPFSSSFRPSHPFSAPSPSFAPTFAGLPRSSPAGPDQSNLPVGQVRQPVPGVQTIGMIGSLSAASAASQLRPSGAPPVQHQQQRLGQHTVRSAASPSTHQTLGSQKFQSHNVPRAPTSSNSPSTPESPQPFQQQWMSAQGKQTHASSLPSSSYRPQMKPQMVQQRSQQPQQQQQHQLLMNSHQLQISSSQQQQQQQQHLQQVQQQQQQGPMPNQLQEQHLPPRNQQSFLQQQHQVARVPASATPKSNVQLVAQSSVVTPVDVYDNGKNDKDIVSRRCIREMAGQIDQSKSLHQEIEDDLLEVAEDFLESIATAACNLAKHRKSTTLEAKDILLHVERHWNMTLPGFDGDEIKCYKKPMTNDIHKERLAMIKKSMVGTEGGSAKNLAAAGQASTNPKTHATKAHPTASP